MRTSLLLKLNSDLLLTLPLLMGRCVRAVVTRGGVALGPGRVIGTFFSAGFNIGFAPTSYYRVQKEAAAIIQSL